MSFELATTPERLESGAEHHKGQEHPELFCCAIAMVNDLSHDRKRTIARGEQGHLVNVSSDESFTFFTHNRTLIRFLCQTGALELPRSAS